MRQRYGQTIRKPFMRTNFNSATLVAFSVELLLECFSRVLILFGQLTWKNLAKLAKVNSRKNLSQ